MNVIFLDIDGVLNCVACRMHGINPEHVQPLMALVNHLDARIVVSSTWRLAGLQSIRKELHDAGVRCPIIGVTPNLCLSSDGLVALAPERGDEIQAWLDANTRPVEAMVILDDCDDMGRLKRFLVKTDFNVGLTSADVERAMGVIRAQRRGEGDEEYTVSIAEGQAAAVRP